MYRVSKVELDASGQPPSRIMIMQTGNWPDSMKGNFTINLDDLKQIKENFDNKIGFPTADASTGLAIDFMHNYAAQAGAWIKGLELDIDHNDPTQGKLFATPIEWTDAGSKAVMSGEFKMISPSGYFGRKNGKLSMWPNPQDLKEKVANVLDGAGLTNIPFLRGMSPIRASAEDDLDNKLEYDKVIFISEKPNKELEMTLDQIRIKEANSLSTEEKAFLEEHRSELSVEEIKKFDMEAKEELSAEDKALLTPENKELLASIKSGEKKVINASDESVDKTRLDSLEATALEFKTEKANTVVEAHVKRGAIKQDAAENWTKRLLSVDTAERTALEADLAALPSNELLSNEIGSGEDTHAGNTARDQLHVIANKKVEEAAKGGKELLYSDALKQAIRENEALSTQDGIEQKTKFTGVGV